MKKITFLFVVLLVFGFYSCDQDNGIESSGYESPGFELNSKGGKPDQLPFTGDKEYSSILNDSKVDYCGEPVECILLAGSTGIDAGTVTVANDDDYLYVKVYSKAGFQDVEENIKMWIGLEAPDRRPSAGQFPYKASEDTDTHIFKIELSTLPEWDDEECEKEYVILVHVDIKTESDGDQTAWAGCDGVIGQPWWAYMEYTTQCCEEEESSLGWLYKEDSTGRNTCFDFSKDEEGVSSMFPYAGGGVYANGKTFSVLGNVDFDEDCGVTSSVKIGEVTVYLLDWLDDKNARVKLVFNFDSNYDVTMGYVYIGWINPIISGEFDPSLTGDIASISVTGNTAEYTLLVENWPGEIGDGGPTDSNGWEQYYISTRFTFSE
ncbi:hypothetical protein [Lutimonas zeaxanthinifaciens]|uniref:hypothetical protein n=1 Tax=Lutimonas zeaxanthinifaciens TaxID=3060215 RepID=UPI00265C9DFB|nr:hypothetical protein [Lutimonas sp. YSD2104]WKK66821.1 hypothetical protein QZH61_04180 [Lutimonas sp. YSD2104]